METRENNISRNNPERRKNTTIKKILTEHTNRGSYNKGHWKHGGIKPSTNEDLEEDEEGDTQITKLNNI